MFKFPPNGAVPQQNPSYPMAGLKSSAYAPPLNYNQPTEVVGGYDAKINPMTGQEMPVTNFARGGLASLRAPQVDDFTRGMHTGLAAYAGGGSVRHFDGGGGTAQPGSAAWNAMYGDTSLESDEYGSGFDYWAYLQDAADRAASDFYIPTEDIFGSSWDSFNYNTSGGDDVDPAYFYGTTDTSGGGGFDYSDEGNTSEKLRQEEELRRQGEQAYEDYLARQNKTAEDVFESAGITPEDRDASRTQSLVEDARYGSLDDTLLSDIDKNISKYSDYWRPEFDFEKESLLDKAKKHISDVLGLAGSTVAGLPGLVVGKKAGEYLESKLGGGDLPEVVVSSRRETPLPTGLSGGFTGGSYYPGGDDSGGGGGPDTSDLSKPMPTTLPPGTTTPTGVTTGPTVPDTPPTPPSKPPTDSTSSVNIPVSSQFLSAYDPMYTASNEQYGGSVEDQIRQYMQATNKSFRPGPITPYTFQTAPERVATPQGARPEDGMVRDMMVRNPAPEQRMARPEDIVRISPLEYPDYVEPIRHANPDLVQPRQDRPPWDDDAFFNELKLMGWGDGPPNANPDFGTDKLPEQPIEYITPDPPRDRFDFWRISPEWGVSAEPPQMSDTMVRNPAPEQRMAHGGMAHAGIGSLAGTYKAGGKLLRGPGDGMSDSIPAVIRGAKTQRAALADGEFVIPADVVSHLGNGSTEAGSRKLYAMMDKVRQARTGRKRQAPAVNANKYLPG
jgi:hypothetical protein